MKKISGIAKIVSVVYIVLFIAAFAYHVSRHEYDKFSAIFVSILTAPWSTLFALLLTRPEVEINFGYAEKNVVLVILAVINTSLILFIGRKRK